MCRVGEININKYGSKMVIERYNSYSDVVVRFVDNNYSLNVQYGSFKTGNVKNPYDRSVYGVGFLGEGKYKVFVDGIRTLQYKTWHGMLQRCYDQKVHKKYPAYKNIYVSKEWQNFQVFGEWFENNYYEIKGEIMVLDKDILVKGNKIYSPEKCVFVPHFINTLFNKSNSIRGELPIGVSWHENRKKFVVQCQNRGKQLYLGGYSNLKEAFEVYKTYKETLIKEIANENKDKIPNILYNAMMKYEVDYND